MSKFKLAVPTLALIATLMASAPASAAPQFHGDAGVQRISEGTQEFVLGSDLLKCATATFEYTPPAPSANTLKIKPTYSGCELNRPPVWEAATMVNENCQWELLAAEGLHMIGTGKFNEGLLSLVKGSGTPACSLRFESGHCGDGFAAQGLLKEFEWDDLNTALGSYESELAFKVVGLTYTHVGTSCGTGTGGEYKSSGNLLKHVVIF